MKKSRRHGQSLFVPAGQIAGHPVFRAAETKPGKHLFYPFFYFLPGQSVSASEKFQIFPDSKHTVERKFLRHISHIGPAAARAVRRFTPATDNSPLLAGRSPQSILNVVDLPAPFGPKSPKISPS